MDLSLIIAIISLIIAIASLGFGIFVYRTHDKIIKEQQEQINKYELEDRETQLEEKKKAKLRGRIEMSVGLIITNEGIATAYDINVTLPQDLKGVYTYKHSPFERLNHDEYYEIPFHLAEGHSETLSLKITWRDEFSNINEYVQVLQIR